MPGLYGNVGNTTVSGGNTTSLYSTNTGVSVSNNLNVNDINASGNLFVAGTGTFGGNITAPYLFGNITGNITAPGATTQVLYNNNGTISGDADFTWNQSTNVLTVAGNVNPDNVNATNVVATNITGTLQTAAQNNITSVGTLTSLNVTGTVSGGNIPPLAMSLPLAMSQAATWSHQELLSVQISMQQARFQPMVISLV